MSIPYFDQLEKENTVKLRVMIDSLPYFCKDFFRGIEPRTTSKTRISYAYDLNVFFDFLKKNNPKFRNLKNISLTDLEKLKVLDIEEYMEYLKYYTTNNVERVNNNTGIKRKISSLKSFFNYFYKNQMINSNPVSLVSLPKLYNKEITRLESDEVVKLIDIVSDIKITHSSNKNIKRDLAIITLLLGTGIRVSECVGINISDIDFETAAIKIKRKGGKEAIIYFSDEVEKYLSDYLTERKKISLSNDENALFLSTQKKRINVRTIEKLVKKYSSYVTPLKKISPHKLRSTFGTNLYIETDDIDLVAEVLGHNDVNTTKKHYAAIEDERKRKARNKVKLKEN